MTIFRFLFILLWVDIIQSIEEIYVWPYPVTYKDTQQGQTINYDSINFKLYDEQQKKYVPIENDSFIYPMVKRYSKILYDTRVEVDLNTETKSISSYDVIFKVEDLTDRSFILETNEEYRINITTERTIITSVNIFGSLRGIETFSQVVTSKTIKNLPIFINDYPRYKWRGFMIDVARHYLHISTLESIIDALEVNKMNVLHIHLEDAQSFPVDIPKYPLLSQKGAYDPVNAIFSQKQLTDLISYGYLRGVRIVPEIDIPGHTYSWGLGYPGITAICDIFMDNLNSIPLDPTNPESYEIAKGVLDYIVNEVFIETEYIHIGGDEVNYACWEWIPHINEYLENHNISGKDLQGSFMNEMISFISSISNNNKKPIIWQELASDMPKMKEYQIPRNNTVVEIWRSPFDIAKVIENGYEKIINSAGWYVDRQFPTLEAFHYLMLDVWQDMWKLELEDYIPSQKDVNKIIGGEICVWGEQINDLVVIQRSFPKASAVAERLWSPKDVNVGVGEQKEDNKMTEYSVDTMDIVQERLNYHICHNMNLRGIKASSIAPNYCPYTIV